MEPIRSTVSFERMEAMLNPKFRKVLRSRFLSIDWYDKAGWDPWIDIRAFSLAGRSLHVEVGRLYFRVHGYRGKAG